MRLGYRLLLCSLTASLSYGQLTVDQKVLDFQALAELYAKRYAPAEWKRNALNFDLFNLSPWLTQVRNTQNDLDYYDVMVSYVASLGDAHSFVSLPANFSANLNFTVDLYDGKLLVDSVNRSRLPANEFGFQPGYELVSIDGQDAQKILDGLVKYDMSGNPRSTRRLAAGFITSRPQSRIPHAPDVPEISTVVFRRSDGNQESYRIPWTRSGLPLVSLGTLISPKAPAAESVARPSAPSRTKTTPPDYLQWIRALLNSSVPNTEVVGNGALAPIFAASMPAGFVQRQGRVFTDPFYSGTFTASGIKLGYIRIPSFSPANPTTATTTFQTEIAFFQANTDALIVDVMRNPGGDGGYADSLLSNLMTDNWRAMPSQIRATSEWVVSISSALTQVKALGFPQSVIDSYQVIYDAITRANSQSRALTDPVPLGDVTVDRPPATDSKGNLIAYTKPVMLLVDDLTSSAAEQFAASFQENARGPLLGFRTMGAGGLQECWSVGPYSQTTSCVTESLMIRKTSISTPEYPAAPFVENIGVRPEIALDYMTRNNLLQNGKPFVDAVVAAMTSYVQKVGK